MIERFERLDHIRAIAAISALAILLLPLLLYLKLLPLLMIAATAALTVVYPPLGVAAVVASVPVQDVAVIPFVRGQPTYTQIVLAGFVLGWFVISRRQRIVLDIVVVGYLAVFAAFSISLAEMDVPSLWVGEVYRWAAAAGFYVLARSVLTDARSVMVVLASMAIGVLFAGGYVLGELWWWLKVNEPGQWQNFRAFGSFGVPNPVAAYMEFAALPLVLFAVLGFRSSVRQRIGVPCWLLCIIAGGLGLLTIALTQSRGGLIGITVGLAVVFLILPRTLQALSVAAAIIMLGAFLLTPFGQSQTDRFTGLLDESEPPVRGIHERTLGRESLWGAGIRMIEDEPYTGVGAGEYDYHYRDYTPGWIDRFPRGQAHNGWLQMGAQAGWPGIAAFTVWLGVTLTTLLGAFRRASDPLARLLAWAGIAVFAAFGVHSLVDYLNVLSLGLQLAVVTAVGLALAPAPVRTSDAPVVREELVTTT